MTNREKLIELLTEKDGKIRAGELQYFLSGSPLNTNCDGTYCIIMAVAFGVIVKTGIECVLYSIPVAVKAPKALAAFTVDSIVMILALPLAYTVKKRVKATI